MSTNVSKEKRNLLIKKIEDIKTFILSSPQDDNTAQLLTYISDIEKDIKGKKYGLVFEEHRESIDEVLENNLPVLTEDADLFIDNGGQMNFLIEGDNLASLKLLEKTHKGRIDLIYIDPPYNTGIKDFVYDDTFVEKSDLYRHSKWLSFIKKRLVIAKTLLSNNGVMFISIDDNEYSALKVLCEEIFQEDNVETLIWRKSGVGRDGKMKNTNTFRIDHEYILVCYIGQKSLNKLIEKPNFINTYSNPDNDPRGAYKAGSISNKEDASNPNSDKYYSVTSPAGIIFTRQFNVSKEEFEELNRDGRIYWGKNGTNVPSIKIFVEEERQITPYSLLLDKGTTTEGTKELNELLNGDYSRLRPKPVLLIQTLTQLGSKQNSVVLDFFAGSGTTGQAIMKLNEKDGGSRKFILCTNNENNICRDVTYERIKRVIAKEDYKASLKYFKVDYLPISDKLYYEYADELLLHIRELVELENGINFNGNTEIAIVLTEKELDDFTQNIPETCKAIYVGHDVLPTEEQEKIFAKRKIKVNVIPEYYYRDLEG